MSFRGVQIPIEIPIGITVVGHFKALFSSTSVRRSISPLNETVERLLLHEPWASFGKNVAVNQYICTTKSET